MRKKPRVNIVMNKMKIFVGATLVLLMLFSLNGMTSYAAPNAKRNGNTASIETNTLVVNVQGGSNVPAFTFYSKSDTGRTYRLQLDSIFEAVDKNGNGVYDLQGDQRVPNSNVALSSLSWVFSSFQTVNDSNNQVQSINFNITSSDGTGLKTSFSLQFRMHLNAANPSQVKFDVVINNYTFKNANAMLVLAFKLITSHKGDSTQSQNKNQVNFGNGYIKGNDTAQTGNDTTVKAGISNAVETGSPKVYLSYGHFSGQLVQDPIIGVQNTIDTGNTSGQSPKVNNIFPGLSKGLLFGTSIFATIVFLAVPVMIYRSKKE